MAVFSAFADEKYQPNQTTATNHNQPPPTQTTQPNHASQTLNQKPPESKTKTKNQKTKTAYYCGNGFVLKRKHSGMVCGFFIGGRTFDGRQLRGGLKFLGRCLRS